MPTSIKDECAIVGIGQTEFSENSGRSELQLTVECVKAAIEDAGLALSDVDGMVTFTTDGSDEIAVMRGLGSEELKFFSRMPHGAGSAISLVHQALVSQAAPNQCAATAICDGVAVTSDSPKTMSGGGESSQCHGRDGGVTPVDEIFRCLVGHLGIAAGIRPCTNIQSGHSTILSKSTVKGVCVNNARLRAAVATGYIDRSISWKLLEQ